MGQVAETFKLYREFKKINKYCKKHPKLNDYMNEFLETSGLVNKFKNNEVTIEDYSVIIAEFNRVKNDYK